MAPPLTFPLRTCLRGLFFGMMMIVLGWAYLQQAHRQISAQDGQNLNAREKRHLVLTQLTQEDMKPDFQYSVSEPLKKLFPHRTDGLAQPLWPWIAAWRLDDADITGSIRSLAWFKVGLTLGALIILGYACARHFVLPAALLIITATAFYGLLPTLTEYSGSTFFHLFYLLTWVACLYALQRNSLWVYGLIGIFGALAYQSEDRILPLLAVFVFVSTVRALWGWLATLWHRGGGTSLWVRRNHLFGLLLMVSAIGFIAGPRLTEAYRQFGDPAFHYNDHIRWLDRPAEAQAWIETHPDQASLAKIPTLERPNPQTYFQTHTLHESGQRLLNGLYALVSRDLKNQGVEILAVLLILLTSFTLACRFSTPKACHAGERLHPETIPTVLFLVLAALIYPAIAAWDLQVMPVDYIRALIGPLTLSLIWGCESVLRRARKRGAHWLVGRGYEAILWLLLVMVLFQMRGIFQSLF